MIDSAVSIAHREFIEFFTAAPTLEAIAAYHLSPQAEAAISHLLASAKAGTLTPAEQAELDSYDHLEHLITMMKLHALEMLGQAAPCT